MGHMDLWSPDPAKTGNNWRKSWEPKTSELKKMTYTMTLIQGRAFCC